MSNIDVKESQWKLVEVGRVLLFNQGPYAGRLAAVVEIIDHKRALVDGPSKSKDNPPVPRHAAALSETILTSIVIPELPRGAGTGALAAKWEKADVEGQWKKNSWYKARVQKERRRNLTDFERFKVMRLKKKARFEVRRAHAGVRKAAK